MGLLLCWKPFLFNDVLSLFNDVLSKLSIIITKIISNNKFYLDLVVLSLVFVRLNKNAIQHRSSLKEF